jgi:WD40 repeat protein
MDTMIFAIGKRLAVTAILFYGLLCAAALPLFAQQPPPTLQIQSGHMHGASGLAFSRDGRHLFSVDASGVLRWDIAAGRIDGRLPAANLAALSVSPDGRWLLGEPWMGTALLWDLQAGAPARSFGGHAYFACFTADGTGVWVAERPPADSVMTAGGSLTCYRLATGEVMRQIDALPGRVLGVSADGREAVTLTGTPTAGIRAALEVEGAACRRWELATGREIARFAELPENLQLGPIAVNADAARVAAVIADARRAPRRLLIWDGRTGKVLHTIPLPGMAVLELKFNADGTQLAAATMARKVLVWDVAQGKPLHTLVTALPDARSVAFSPDGARLATALVTSIYQPDAHEIDVWDVETGEVAQVLTTLLHPAGVIKAALTPDGRWLAVATAEEIFLFDLAHGRPARVIPLPATGQPRTIALSPDGSILAAAARFGPMGASYREMTHRLLAWNTATGESLPTLTRDLPNFTQIAFSPTGELLATGVSEQRVQLWNPMTGQEVQATPRIEGFVTDITFSADGKRLAWVCNDRAHPDATDLTVGRLDILEIATGAITSYRADENMTLARPFFSPDDGQVLVYSTDQRFILPDAAPKQQLLLISAGAGTVTRRFEMPPDEVIPLGFEREGAVVLAAGSRGGAIVRWDVATGKILETAPVDGRSCRQLLTDRAASRRVAVFFGDVGIRVEPAPREGEPPGANAVEIRLFQQKRWLISTAQGYFDCPPEMEPFLSWGVNGETFPFRQYAPTYRRPDRVTEALAGE